MSRPAMQKFVKWGLGYVVRRNWERRLMYFEEAKRYGARHMDKRLKACGFVCIVADCGDYYRINIGKKC